jgi:ABC-type uncharacterized transport system involved in gliding motility auxiliary subunit
VTLPIGQGASDYQQMEAKITAGLMRMSNPKPAVVYFTSGHGEFPIEQGAGPLGLTSFKAALEGDNYTIKSLTPMTDKQIPDDATLVVICNVVQDFLPDETAAIEKYLERGGRLLVFFNASDRMRPFPNLEKLLSAHGISAQNDLVLSTRSVQIPGSKEGILIPAVDKYGSSPITEHFDQATAYPIARSFKVEKAPQGANVSPLAFTDDRSWQIRRPMTNEMLTILAQTMNPQAIFDKAKDTQGSAILAVAGTYSTAPVDVNVQPAASPSASGAPSPAASGAPSPAASGAPSPAASGAPSPAASGAPSPAASGAPSPAASGAPSPAASGAPSPGASGSPAAGPSPNASPEVKKEARIVVFGSSQMVGGIFFGQLGNGNLALNAISWLAERNEQIALNRPEVKKQPITLDPKIIGRIDWFSMPMMPCIVGLIGLFVVTLGRRR